MEELLERRISRSSRREPIKALFEKVQRCRMLLRHAEQALGKDRLKIKAEARRQYIVSLVTAFEVFLGDLVIQLLDSGSIKVTKSIRDAVSKKYDIADIEDILKNNITLGELISNQINFQNLDVAFSFLTKLFDTNFSDLLYGNKFVYMNVKYTEVTLSIRRSSHKKLVKLIKMRHQFVHDMVFNNTPPISEVISYGLLIRRVAVCIDVKADQYKGLATSKIIKK